MNNRELVYKALDLIELKLEDSVTAGSLSKEFGFSDYYFSKIFKGITGYNLKDYILNRKISNSISDLLDDKFNIIDIAMKYGFKTHESFTRAFNRIVGELPSTVRANGFVTDFNIIKSLNKNELENSRLITNQEPEIVVLDSFLVGGIPFYYDLSIKNDLSKPWNNLLKYKHLLKNRVHPEKYYQFQSWFEDQESDFLYFFIGLELLNKSNIPQNFSIKEIPRITYLKFKHIGKSSDVGKTYDFIYNCFLPESNYKLPHSFNFEIYPNNNHDPYDINSISEIYIPIE